MGRPSRLDNPDFLKAVALAYVEGVTREEAADMFGVSQNSLYTITRWFRDPRVQALAGELAQARMLTIVRKTDSEIQRRLMQPGELDVDELLRIRKEFAPKTAKAGEVGTTPETTTTATEAMEEDPDLADKLLAKIEAEEAARAAAVED